MIWKAFLDGELLGSNVTQQTPETHLIESNLGLEISKTGSFAFKIAPAHHLYNKIFKIKSLIEIVFDNDIMFRGRVLDTDDTLSGELSVNCEGCLAYLLDSYIDSYEEVERTPKAQLEWLINRHNSQMEGYKHFIVGNVTIPKANNREKFSSSSDQKIQDAIFNDLVGRFGGFIKVRYVGNTNYIDWYAIDSGDISTQPLKFGMNMIDLTRRESADDIFSILKPVGDDDLTIESVNGGSKYIINQEMLSKFGTIYRVEHFSGVSEPRDLLSRGNTFIEQNATGLTESLTITALDFVVIDSSVSAIRTGMRVEIVVSPINLNKIYTCGAINYDLINIDRTQYTLGTIRQSLTDYHATTAKTASEASSRSSSNGAKIGKTNDAVKKVAGDLEVTADNIKITTDRLEADVGDLFIKSGDLSNRMNGAEASIEMHEGEIKLRAKQVDVDRIDEVLYGSAEGQAGLIGKSAELFTRMRAAEIEINGDEGSIGLKGLTSELYGDTRKMREDFDVLSKQVDQQGERVTQAEVNINSMKGEIELRVKSTEFNDELERIDNAITVNRQNINLKVSINDVINQINLSTEGILIKANRINLSGYVTASQFSTKTAEIDKLLSGTSTINYLAVGQATISNLYAPTNFTFQGWGVSRKTRSVVTSVSEPRFNYVTLQYLDHNGSSKSQVVLTSVSSQVSTSSSTIRYLGGDWS